MLDFLGPLIPNLMIGAVVIAGIYFIYCLFEFLGASSRSLVLWWQIYTKKNKQEVKNPVTILKIRYAKGEIKKEEYEEMKKVLEK